MIKSNNMKIGIISLCIASFMLVTGISAVYAAVPASDCTDYCANIGTPSAKDFPTGKTCICNPLGQGTGFTDVVDKILNIIFFVAIAVAPVMIIVAGFKFLTGGANPETLKSARMMLIWTAVGFGIILLSKGIVLILRGVLGF